MYNRYISILGDSKWQKFNDYLMNPKETEHQSYSILASPNHPIQYEDPLKYASAPEVSLIDCNENDSFPFDELNQRMATMRLVQHSNNNFSCKC